MRGICFLFLMCVSLTGAVYGQTSSPGTMPGIYSASDGQGNWASVGGGYQDAPTVYWSSDNGETAVEVTKPPKLAQYVHHDPSAIGLDQNGFIIVFGAMSVWNNEELNWDWYHHYIVSMDRGKTWGEWIPTHIVGIFSVTPDHLGRFTVHHRSDAPEGHTDVITVQAVASAGDWQYYE